MVQLMCFHRGVITCLFLFEFPVVHVAVFYRTGVNGVYHHNDTWSRFLTGPEGRHDSQSHMH